MDRFISVERSAPCSGLRTLGITRTVHVLRVSRDTVKTVPPPTTECQSVSGSIQCSGDGVDLTAYPTC
jgi:hypothetical protein